MTDLLSKEIWPYEKGRQLSKAEFDAMREGKTRTKFKIIVDPDNGKIFRLVMKGVDAEASHYVEMEPKPTEVHEYALASEAKQNYAIVPIEPLKRHYSIHSYRIQSNPTKPPEAHELSRLQFFELEKAVSLSSRWWPLEGLSWQAEKNLAQTEVNVLFHGRMPIGFIAIEDCGKSENDRPHKSISMVGLMPGHRGSGHGNYLVRWAIKRILEQSPDADITLTTSELDKKQSGKTARELYEKLGFKLQKTQLVDPGKIIAEHKDNLAAINLYNAYAPDTYDEEPGTGRKLPRFTQAELERRVRAAFGMERAS